MGIIFVGGVHAVGKTTTCELLSRELDFEHYSASSLIRSERESAIPTNTKVVKDLKPNQDLLVRAIVRVTNDFSERAILDGHFTIPNSAEEIETISLSVFRSLKLECIVLLYDSPDKIATRFRERDGRKRELQLIVSHQNTEIFHAQFVARSLNIPLISSKAFSTNTLAEDIREVIC